MKLIVLHGATGAVMLLLGVGHRVVLRMLLLVLWQMLLLLLDILSRLTHPHRPNRVLHRKVGTNVWLILTHMR
jgi:hypothetical protein